MTLNKLILKTGSTKNLKLETAETLGTDLHKIYFESTGTTKPVIYDVINVDHIHTIQLLPAFVDFSDDIAWGSAVVIVDGTWAGTERVVNQSGYYGDYTYIELHNPWLPCTGGECDFTQVSITPP